MDRNQAHPSDTVQDRNSQKKTVLLSPASLALLTFMAGPHISLFPGLQVISRPTINKGAAIPLLSCAVLFPALYIFLLLWPTQWYWSSLILLGAHILCSVGYYLLFRNLQLSHTDDYQNASSGTTSSGPQFILPGIAGGIFFLPMLGIAFIIAFILGIDHMLSTFMPVAFDDTMSLVLLVFGLLGLSLSGAIAGGWLGKLGLQLRPLQLIGYSFCLIWIAGLWYLFLQLLIVLPGFLTSQMGNYALIQPLVLFFFGNILIGSLWSAYLLFFTLRPASINGRCTALLTIPIISLSSAFIFAMVCGYPSNWFHSAGKMFEKRGQIATSLWCYEKGMSKHPTGEHASYLQYRIALLSHKLGEREKATKGFQKVVSMFNRNDDLVAKSTEFLDNLKRNDTNKKRVVLPGVENPTAYKGAYCVPNSLALVMNFWGAGIDANTIGQAITSLSSGTMVIDQAWYAEQQGFRHEFMPLATTADITSTIDAGFPVLVYVPAHVFVIVGYDEILETFVTYDVATKDIWVDYLQKDFIKSWKKEDTTMVVVYPPGRESRLPERIRDGLTRTSNEYLQYHLHYLDSPEGYPSVDRLLLAAANSTEFFLPLVKAYQEFPSLRPSLLKTHDVEGTANRIIRFFNTDFDEGTHLSGQMHYDDYVNADRKLEASLEFLIGTGLLEQASNLIKEIDSKGEISTTTKEIQAMLELSRGDFDNAIPHLTELDDDELQFYLSQSYLRQGNITSAITGLVKTIDNCT